MRILLSNDDGYDSPGIQLLYEKLNLTGFSATIVAPQRERSTAGHSLTLHKPLRIYKTAENVFAVSGSPADCVHLALRKILPNPDLVISGINRGANLGLDLFYSGTVAAAREAYLFGLPVMAISLCIGFESQSLTSPNWNTAVDFALDFALKFKNEKNFRKHFFYNVNVPDLPKEQIQGVELCTQGRRLYSDNIVEGTDPRGRPYYWIGGGPSGFENTPGSDCNVVSDKKIAMVPLSVNTTDYDFLKNNSDLGFSNWL